MNLKKRFTPLNPFVFIILAIGGAISGCFLIRYLAFYTIVYTRHNEEIQTHKIICQNLVEMRQIKEDDCLSPSTYYEEYIPVYFPIESTTKEIVWQGMMDVTILDNRNTSGNSCEGRNGQGSALTYRIMFGFNVSFVLCGNQLVYFSYQN